MIYVMSDLHGEYDKFIKMLDKIDFSDEDTLYILGDVLDRGKDAIKIIDYIRENNNIHLLMGNHELLFVMAYDNPEYMVHWIQNGGSSTYIELAERGFGYMKKLILKSVIEFHKHFLHRHINLFAESGVEVHEHLSNFCSV